MNEDTYVFATNVAKLRVARNCIRDAIATCLFTRKEQAFLVQSLETILSKHDEVINADVD